MAGGKRIGVWGWICTNHCPPPSPPPTFQISPFSISVCLVCACWDAGSQVECRPVSSVIVGRCRCGVSARGGRGGYTVTSRSMELRGLCRKGGWEGGALQLHLRKKQIKHGTFAEKRGKLFFSFSLSFL